MVKKVTNYNTITLLVIIAALVAVGGTIFALTRNTGNKNPDTSTGRSDGESATYRHYAALKGEPYDRMFLAEMITHHQGAVDMANLAQTKAKHSELKTMSNNIIAAQTKEIADMTTWQRQWGYPTPPHENMMGMEGHMMDMILQLKDLTGDDFDKKFLQLMIEHHQSAIDMARPGETNAHHQELKTLTKAIVRDQSQEIDQMRAWQVNWGYENTPNHTSH